MAARHATASLILDPKQEKYNAGRDSKQGINQGSGKAAAGKNGQASFN
jgi:hypothetical protein